MTQETLKYLECIRCGRMLGDGAYHAGCPDCAARGKPSNWKTTYDLEIARPAFETSTLAGKSWGMWRYDALLPFSAGQAVTLGEGGTPLISAPRLAKYLGLRTLWVKDESRNPTWAFKDRSMSVGATHALHLGNPAVVVSSTGNAAAATAAYSRRAGLPVIVFFARGVDSIMSAFVRSYGALVVSTPSKPERWTMVRHCVEKWGCYPAGNYLAPPIGLNPFMVDGYKTIGFEIWEQLGRRAPEWIFTPVGESNCIYGIYKSFQELSQMGYAESPRLGAAEIYGSLTRAIQENDDAPRASVIERGTVAFSIATAQNTYHGFVSVQASNGMVAQVADDEILKAQKLLVENEGIFAEATSATSLAALIRGLETRTVSRDAEAVILITSCGLKSLNVTSPKDEVPMVNHIDELSLVLKERYGFSPQIRAESIQET